MYCYSTIYLIAIATSIHDIFLTCNNLYSIWFLFSIHYFMYNSSYSSSFFNSLFYVQFIIFFIMISDFNISLLIFFSLSAVSRRELFSLSRTSENSSIEMSFILQQMNCEDKYYIIWNTDQAEMFISWWNQLSKTKKCQQSESKKAHSCWNNAYYIFKNWQHFHQTAEKKTGISDMICKKCHTVIAHLIYFQDDSSEMNKHIESKDCFLNIIMNQINIQNVSLLLISQFI